jgi:hypothetical protein
MLTLLEISETITTIEKNALKNCVNIQELTIPESVSFVDSTAFIGTGIKVIYTVTKNQLNLFNGNGQSIGGLTNLIVLLTDYEAPIGFRGTPIFKTLNNAILRSKSSMPFKDITTDNSNSFAMNRNKYMRTKDNSINDTNRSDILKQKKWYNNNDHSNIAQNTHNVKRIDYPKTVFNIDENPMSYTTINDEQLVQQSLQKMRSQGSIVIPKKTQKNVNN